ncbi:wd g-beta repeat-containing protein, partial [Cystoisospora suis]
MEMKSSSSSCCSPMVIAGGLDSCLFVWNAVTSACIANFQLPPDQHVNALCSPCLSSTSCSSLSRALALDADDVEDEEDEEDRNYYRDRYQSEAFQDPSPSHLSSSFSCYTLQKSRRRTSSQSSSCSRDHHYHVGRANCDGGGVKETQEKKETREKETPCTASSLHLPFVVAAGNPSVSVFDVSLLAERSSEIPPYVTLQGQ